jgi:hypothetical protein
VGDLHSSTFHRRFNGDHKTLNGKYPMNLWQPGDSWSTTTSSPRPNFTAGTYNVYYGLYTGDTRLKVKTGRHDENRIEGATSVSNGPHAPSETGPSVPPTLGVLASRAVGARAQGGGGKI